MEQGDIVVDGLWYWYEDSGPVLADVSLRIDAGDCVAITGQNGSGKTTLAKHFNGLLQPKRGRVLVMGQDTTRLSVGELSRRVGYVFQNPDYQIFSSTVREELAFGPRNLGLAEGEVRGRVAEAMAAFGLEPYAQAPPTVLAYGLKRKVTLAAVYAMKTPILVLDEPTVGLDRGAASDLMERVSRLHRSGHTVIIITHDMRLVAEYAAKVAVLHQGRLLTYGATRSVFQQTELLAASSLAQPQITALAGKLEALGVPIDALTVREVYDSLRQVHSRLTGRQ